MSTGNPNSETRLSIPIGTEAGRSGCGHKDNMPRDPLIEYTRQVSLKYAGEDIDVSAAFRPFLQAIKKLFNKKS